MTKEPSPYLKFTDKENDSTVLYYFGARFYDPEVGRFISVDPAKDGDNWYAYCGNNPIKYVDPNGQTLIPFDYKLLKAAGKWVSDNAGALIEMGCGALMQLSGYGADGATGAAVVATDGAAIVAVPGEQALSAGAKAAGMSMMAHGASRLKGGNDKTVHGEKRAQERGFSDEKINDIKETPSHKVYQSEGRTVYAKRNGNITMS